MSPMFHFTIIQNPSIQIDSALLTDYVSVKRLVLRGKAGVLPRRRNKRTAHSPHDKCVLT